MSDKRFASQPDEILRRLGTQLVPVDEPERVEQRREQVVDALSRAIRANADRQRSTLRTRLLVGFGLAAAVALGLGISARVRGGHDSPDARALLATVSEVHGAVVVTEGGESRVLSKVGPLALHALGEIETAPDAQAEIRSQKSVVHIGAATKLTVPQATSVEERYRLALGRVDVSVDKDSRLLRSVVVETPNAEVVVHGTVFAVGVSRTDHTVTEVSVTRGSVWVLANGVQVAVLGPGQHWSSDAPPRAEPPPAPAPVVAPVASLSDERVAPHGGARPSSPRERAVAEAKANALAEQSRLFQDAIDARNRGDDARAVELFSHLVQRYPNYEEAEVQLFRAEKRLGRAATAAAEARRYLGLHPQGFAHDEARALALSSTGMQSPQQPR